jgi:hypothetical protein
MAKNKWIKDNILTILAILILLYGGTHGWFGGTSWNITNLLNDANNADTSGKCTLSLNKANMCVGDTLAGTIKTSPNTRCVVFGSDGTQWKAIYDGISNSAGFLTDSTTINTVGNFVLRAVCDLNGDNSYSLNDCITNSVNLNVYDCDDDDDDDDDSSDDSSDSDDSSSDDDSYSGEMACSAVYNPTPETCSEAYCSSGNVCIYYEADMITPAHCGCAAPPRTCDEVCRYSAYASGYCSYDISRDPCGDDVNTYLGNEFCKQPLQIGSCCCRYN